MFKQPIGRKNWVFFAIFIFLIMAVLLTQKADVSREKAEEPEEPEVCLQLQRNCFELEVADTYEKHMRGLSGRKDLPMDTGMLFVFEQIEEQCFWMKDMRFSLDIIWTDEHKKITKIEKNVSPDTYPDSFCVDNTKYVLEFNRGFASKYGLKAGTKLQFE